MGAASHRRKVVRENATVLRASLGLMAVLL